MPPADRPAPPAAAPPADITLVQRDVAGAVVRATRRRPELRWTDAAGAHTFRLAGERAVVGTAPEVDLRVADPAVSRLHAELELRADGVWVRDLDSRNGTFVNDVRVRGARVPDGGTLRLGSDTALTLALGREEAPVELWPAERFGPLLGRSVAMRELFARLDRLARTDMTVLLRGETGTGKELVAEAIHQASPRASQPFVIVDCAALPENLLEAELFGHARGAFTGAAGARAGAFEVAHGGTLFLDEVGELPLAMQPKLLRALEARAVRRIGETEYRKVDVRFVAATHRDLRKMVNQGAFREDLYFRLAVLPVVVPPLRERAEDIAPLVEHFLPPGARGALTSTQLAQLAARPWLGNVRELRNFVDRAVALGARDALAMEAQQQASSSQAGEAGEGSALPAVPLDRPFKDLREEWLSHLEREYLRGLLARHGNNVSAVAQAAGLDRTYVHRLLRKHDL